MTDGPDVPGAGAPAGQNPAEGEPRRVDLRINQSGAETTYVNSFKHHPTPEEFMLDLGVNRLEPTGDKDRPVEVQFTVSTRLVMNYHTVKRLAAAMADVVRRYESRFGPLELDARKRGDLSGENPGS